MKTVNVDRDKLLELVQANRDTHQQDYNEAIVKWRDEAKAALIRGMENLDSGVDELPKLPVKPMQYLEEYDRAIRMLSLTIDTAIELDAHEFDTLVNDKWVWKNQFAQTTLSYLGKMG